MGGLFGIGVSGLLTAQQQLSTTGHNISNVNTEGYARQRTEQATLNPSFSGAGYIGNGVQTETTVRFYDEFLEDQIRTSNSQLGKFDRYNNLAAQVDNILANPDAGLTPTMESYFNALQEANDYPSSAAARSVLLTEANTMANRFQLIQNRFIDLNNQVNNDLADVASEISARASSIADINKEIALQTGAAQGDTPNDALDKREQLIKEISERIEVNVVYQDNGMANVFIGSGQSLVLGSNSFTMTVENDEYTPRDKRIMLNGATGSIEMTSQVRGGELEGLINFKSEVLETSFNALGRIAASVTTEVNSQHQLGMTMRETAPGEFNLGGNFFNDLRGTATRPLNALNSSNNIGTASYNFNITDTSVLTTSDYEMVYTTPGGVDTFTMTRLSDGVVFSGTGASAAAALTSLNNNLANTPANSIDTAQGISVSLTAGAAASGDRFLIQPTHDQARDISVEITEVLDIALASPISMSQGTNNLGVGTNTGSGDIEFLPFTTPNGSVTNIPITDAGNNQVNIILTYNGTGFDITSSGAGASPAEDPGPIAYTTANSGQTFNLPGANYNNINFILTGAPDVGDTFVIGNNTNPHDDNRNGLILANLQTKKSMENSSSDFQRAYGLMVADVGTRTHSSEVDLAAQTTLKEQAVQTRESLSGVNLDEEASQLLKFQQAYSAAAKIISTADEVFQTLLSATS